MILFVDDEGRRVAPWLEALEEAFGPVRLCVDPDAALVLLEADPWPEVRLLVWDLMMPTSGAGRLTGDRASGRPGVRSGGCRLSGAQLGRERCDPRPAQGGAGEGPDKGGAQGAAQETPARLL